LEDNTTHSKTELPQINSVFSFYGFAWKKMWKYFLELLLVTIISVIIVLPSAGLENNASHFFDNNFVSIDLFIISFQGFGAYLIFVIAYMTLLQWPLEYGISYINLQAARDSKFKVTDIFIVFKNYWNAVFANLLVITIVGFGIMLLIVPGIIFACKLAFVPYLVVDKKMDAVEAVKESWSLTKGYTGTVFLTALTAFFVGLLGLLAFGVGIIISIIWIRVTFAAIYYKVISENELLVQNR
jgi:uncharacterized membrane protein